MQLATMHPGVQSANLHHSPRQPQRKILYVEYHSNTLQPMGNISSFTLECFFFFKEMLEIVKSENLYSNVDIFHRLHRFAFCFACS